VFIADENLDSAAVIIESAGMSVKGRSYPVKEPFSVRPWRVSGAVRLMVLAAGKTAEYQWQVSGDAGQTWKDRPPTLQARTTVDGLTPQKTYWFRYRVVVRSGPGDWSEALSIVVR
jgi:hypothetical protein